MKKIISLCIALLASSYVHAECQMTKNVPLSTWFKSADGQTNYYISNISKHPIDLSIKLFKPDGQEYLESTESGTHLAFSGAFTTNPNNTPTLLEAGKTGRFQVKRGGGEYYGHAILTWESEVCLINPLNISFNFASGDRFTWFHVNGGKGI